MERDKSRRTQNHGVSIVAKTFQVSSSKDKNHVECDMTYYGVIKEIWKLDYINLRIPLFFLYDWVKNDNGIKKESFGFTLVDLNRIGHKSDRFIMASQAKQVFYVIDPLDARCSVVLISIAKDYIQESHNNDVLLEQETFVLDAPLLDVICEDENICNTPDLARSGFVYL